MAPRRCLREPIEEIFDAARYLDAAVSAHLAGRRELAEELIRLSDMPKIREWTDSIWGKNSKWVRFRAVADEHSDIAKEKRTKARMPNREERRQLHNRDGHHCRFCGIPVIRAEVRRRIGKFYPGVLKWGKRNTEQHAAFQAMWLQYDHLLPHARGGNNSLENVVITCAPCNFGRMNYTLREVGLLAPANRLPTESAWDGLERFG